jgi:hypothetical protein
VKVPTFLFEAGESVTFPRRVQVIEIAIAPDIFTGLVVASRALRASTRRHLAPPFFKLVLLASMDSWA